MTARIRAVLKSWRMAGGQEDDLVEATAHSVPEGGKGAIPLARLAAGPGPILPLHGSPEDAQDGDRDGMTNPALVLPRAHIQRIMSAVFDAPIQSSQFQQTRRIGLGGGQAGNDPDGFDFLFATLQLANAVNARDLNGMREPHLFRSDFLDLDAPPLDAPVPLVDRHHLRGKNPPAGGAWLGCGGFPGCP